MDLRYDPIRKVVGGYKEVDMCLYDGVGSQSEFLGVTVRDSGPRPPPGRDYAVRHGTTVAAMTPSASTTRSA